MFGCCDAVVVGIVGRCWLVVRLCVLCFRANFGCRLGWFSVRTAPCVPGIVPSGRAASVGPTCMSGVTRCVGGVGGMCICAWCRRIATSRGTVVRHRVLKTLGREDELKASGQLEQLMGSFARLDPPIAGVRREVGPLLLAWHFISESGPDRHGRSRAAAARPPAVVGRRGGGGADLRERHTFCVSAMVNVPVTLSCVNV